MKVVVVGKGGREHALAQKLKESSLVHDLWVCPGNPGMQVAGLQCKAAESPAEIEAFCLQNQVSLVVVGPEAAILSDLKQRLETQGISCFAPSAKVAELESSKLFCKGILKESQVPTAACHVGYSEKEAMTFLEQHDFQKPIVVKADGLAQGKGVWVCESLEKSQEAVRVLGSHYGYPLLLEECLIGKELSAFALCDGKDFVLLGTACDYKRITPDPFSANTGGMGAYSPCDFITSQDEETIRQIFSKTLSCLQAKNLPYQGFLFAGLMKTNEGLFVLEYNVRMGDPETQALLPRLKTDLAKLIVAAVTHELKNQKCEVKAETSVHVVAVSEGYPQGPLNTGHPVMIESKVHHQLYYAGVSEKQNALVNSGGRVLGVTALASSRKEARELAYKDIQKVSFKGMYVREDIGL